MILINNKAIMIGTKFIMKPGECNIYKVTDKEVIFERLDMHNFGVRFMDRLFIDQFKHMVENNLIKILG